MFQLNSSPFMCNISYQEVGTPLWEDGIAFWGCEHCLPYLKEDLWRVHSAGIVLFPVSVQNCFPCKWFDAGLSCPNWSLWPRGTLRSLCFSQSCRFLFYIIAFCFSFWNEKRAFGQCSGFCLAAAAEVAITSSWKPVMDCMTKALIWVHNL